MNAVKQKPISGYEPNHPKAPVVALGKAGAHEMLDPVSFRSIGDAKTMEQRAIDRWENEGGEIPNVQRN
jgi:hypothetical protein